MAQVHAKGTHVVKVTETLEMGCTNLTGQCLLLSENENISLLQPRKLSSLLLFIVRKNFLPFPW